MRILGLSITWLLAVLVAGCTPPQKSSKAAAGSASVQVTCTQGTGPFSGGTGTTDDPYVICSESDLEALDTALSGSDYDSFKDKHYIQARDIDLGGVTKSYLPLGLIDRPFDGNPFALISSPISSKPFLGRYNGNLKKILNLAFKDSSNFSGLGFFAMIGPGGIVERLTFEDPVFELQGVLVAGTVAASNSGRIRDITITNLQAHFAEGAFMGGVSGVAIGALEFARISVSGSISADLNPELNTINPDDGSLNPGSNVIAGITPMVIAQTEAMTSGNVSDGIHTLLEDVASSVDISIIGDAAGISLLLFGPVVMNRVSNSGSISTHRVASGILGSTGKLDVIADQVLPFDGPVATHVTNSGTITVSGDEAFDRPFATGIVGASLDLVIEDSGNSGPVIHTHRMAGGAAGFAGGLYHFMANRVYNTGDVRYLGAKFDLLGNEAKFGDVASLFAHYGSGGPSVAQHRVSIQNCYASGTTQTEPYANDIGGIIADIWDLPSTALLEVSHCFVSASLVGGQNGESGRGVVFGQVNIGAYGTDGDSLIKPVITLDHLYWNTTLANRIDPYLGEVSRGPYVDAGEFVNLMGGQESLNASFIGLTTDQMHDPDSFDFDYHTTWNPPTESVYPTLK